MREYGGYLQAERNTGAHYYPNLIRVNSGRNAALLVVQGRNYKKVYLPDYLCDSVPDRLAGQVELATYPIGPDLRPVGLGSVQKDEAVFLVNYFGMYDREELLEKQREYGNLIVDNTQAFFHPPVPGIDTVYTCRKYFGVTDGAYIAAEGLNVDGLEQSKSLDYLDYLFGRFENTAQEHFGQYHKNEERLDHEPPMRMSSITDNLLSGIDYEAIRQVRSENYRLFHEKLASRNLLDAGSFRGDFMYPFYHERGAELKKNLIGNKIFVPTLWPNVRSLDEDRLERKLTENLVLLPVDQRYGAQDVLYMLSVIDQFLGGNSCV